MRLGVAAALVDGEVVPGDLDVDEAGGTIRAVGSSGAGEGLAVPGLVDLQVNGVAEVDLRDADPDGYARASLLLAAGGATAVQPTLHSQPLAAYRDGLAVLDEIRADPPRGCAFLSAHLEGPLLNSRWAGAHDPAHLLAADRGELVELLSHGPVGMVTLAPELPGATALVAELVGRGVVVSLGHTDADAAVARAAFDAGARHLTHCWNAHRRLLARDPGPAGAALADPRVVVGLVCDLAHVAPEVVRFTLAAAHGRVAATTDSVAAPTDGSTGSGGAADVARRGDGTVAGGLQRPVDLLANLVALDVPLAEAVHACGGVQRRLLGLAPVRLRPGDPADVVVLDDRLEVRRTLVGGREGWRA